MEVKVSALDFARETLFNSQSPACLWRHPIQAGRVISGALGNMLMPMQERLPWGGGRRECPVCGWQGRNYRNFLSADEVIEACICPACGSFDRHRQLVLGVRSELAKQSGWNPDVILGYSLSTAMRFLLEHEGLARCFRTDIDADDDRFAPDIVSDLRRAPFADESVDWIFCSHVLEHITELEACVDQIQRMLKPGGVAWIQVPFEPGRAHSCRIEIDPNRAHAHAWQFAPDFPLLIDRDEWEISEIIAGDSLTRAEMQTHGVDPLERYWLARKKK